MRTSWRNGSTSYVYPGDLVYNLRALEGEVEDVELILFDDGKGASNLPTHNEVREMAALLSDTSLSVTVHLPRDVGGLLDVSELKQALALNRRVVDLTQPLSPVAFIFHAHTEGNGTEPWQESVLEGIAAMAQMVERPRQLALENLESYAPEVLEPIFAQSCVSRALDIGHLWKQRRDPLEIMAQWLPSASVVHLHGVCEEAGRMVDHLSLASMEQAGANAALEKILPALQDFGGVLTLEVFEQDYFSSRAALNRALLRVGEGGLDAK